MLSAFSATILLRSSGFWSRGASGKSVVSTDAVVREGTRTCLPEGKTFSF